MMDVLWEGLHSRSSCARVFPSSATSVPFLSHGLPFPCPESWLLSLCPGALAVRGTTLRLHICGPRLQNTDFKCMRISILIGEKGEAKHRP